MTASSQTPPGAPRLEPVPAPWPPNGGHQPLCAYVGGIGPNCTCTGEPAAAAALVSPDVPAHLVVNAPEPSVPQCNFCGMTGPGPLYPDPHGRRYPSGAQVLYCGTCVPDATPAEAVAAVVAAEMGKDAPVTARDIARAEEQAGIVFDPARIQAAIDAAVKQAHAEDQAELTERGRQLAAMAGSARQRDAVLRLLEGRPGDYHLPVAMVAAAVEYGSTPYDAMPPMTLKWTGGVHLPTPGVARRQAVVECETPYGTRADLVVEDPDRQALANLLDLEVVLDIHAPCPHSTACGAPGADLDASDPGLFGWACLDFAGLDDGPRWYCSPPCIFRAQARAGEKLAAIDDQLELDGGL